MRNFKNGNHSQEKQSLTCSIMTLIVASFLPFLRCLLTKVSCINRRGIIMSRVTCSIKVYRKTSEVSVFTRFFNVAKQKSMKVITAFGEFYFCCPKNPTHIRHYVDPITGRAVPTQKIEN